MDTEERNRLVITPDIPERLKWIVFSAFVIIFGFVHLPLSIVIVLTVGMLIIGLLGPRKVIIDKVTQTIEVQKKWFFFFHRKRVTPFSSVTAVVINYQPGQVGSEGGSTPAKWEVYVSVGGDSIHIDRSQNEWGMWALGLKISELIGKDMIDRSTEQRFFHKEEHLTTYKPKMTREETVEKWKKRIEKERVGEERKKQEHGNR